MTQQDDIGNLALRLVTVSEAAAIRSMEWIGRGDKNKADDAAVEGMRQALDAMPIDGVVVIGEGEMDEAPMLYIGERMGAGGPAMDIAVDPLEGTNMVARDMAGAITVIALARSGCMLHAPDVYMDKIAVGPHLPAGVVDLDAPIETNLKNLARAKGKPVSDLTLCTLDRPRHEDMIRKVHALGVRVRLISDGDVAAIMATCLDDVDIYAGIGGAPEGVLAAAAQYCMGGQMQARLVFEDDEQRARAAGMVKGDPSAKLEMHDLVSGEVLFAATGVTHGSPLLKGVHIDEKARRVHTHTVIMDSATKTVRFMESYYPFSRVGR